MCYRVDLIFNINYWFIVETSIFINIITLIQAAENLPLIRPLGSAPELPVKNWNNLSVGPGIIRMPIRPALRQTPQQNFAAATYGMMRMPQPHMIPPQSKRKKSFKSSLNTSTSLVGGGSNKRVMFSGVSDNESASESQDDSIQNAHSSTLPILKVREISMLYC